MAQIMQQWRHYVQYNWSKNHFVRLSLPERGLGTLDYKSFMPCVIWNYDRFFEYKYHVPPVEIDIL